MAQILVSHLTFSYEGSFDNIFEDVSFSIDTDWKLGFIGRNGKGKTTFLNLLRGNYPYTGSISARTVFDYFPYFITEEQKKRPAAEFIEELKNQCELWRVICELEQMHESMGMPFGKYEEAPSGDPSMPFGKYEETLYRPFGTLSPGEQTKVLLAVLFSGENDFLLVDEPTNHLDQATREIVKRYLASKKGFILVSHDRDLLDACVDHVLVLNKRSIEVLGGNFSSWWENKRRSDQFAQAENEKHLREIRKLKQAAEQSLRWADKNESSKIGFDPIKEPDRCKGTRPYIGAKTKKMQKRVKQMNRRIDREIRAQEGLLTDVEEIVDLKVIPLEHHKKRLVDLRSYSVRYTGMQEPVFRDLTFSVHMGDRIALHGENGCGKSTLIKMILQKAGEPGICMPVTETGVCETVAGLIVSYVNQDTSRLRGSISDFCAGRNLDVSLFGSILRQLGLERVQLSKRLEEFSEGQKKKALLAASLLTPAHLYVWDEPLNYVDLFSRMQIEKLLLEYQPTMLFVEHDVRFREKIATEEILF